MTMHDDQPSHKQVSVNDNQLPKPKRLRSACDFCRQVKVKCLGGNPCSGCRTLDVSCIYSTSNYAGRPRGSKNKKTLERLQQLQSKSAHPHPEHGHGTVANSCDDTHRLVNNCGEDLGSERNTHGLPTPAEAHRRSLIQQGSQLQNPETMLTQPDSPSYNDVHDNSGFEVDPDCDVSEFYPEISLDRDLITRALKTLDSLQIESDLSSQDDSLSTIYTSLTPDAPSINSVEEQTEELFSCFQDPGTAQDLLAGFNPTLSEDECAAFASIVCHTAMSRTTPGRGCSAPSISAQQSLGLRNSSTYLSSSVISGSSSEMTQLAEPALSSLPGHSQFQCGCMLAQISLLSRLAPGSDRDPRNTLSLEDTLVGTQHAIKAWKKYLNCKDCSVQSHIESISTIPLLIISTIHIVVQNIHREWLSLDISAVTNDSMNDQPFHHLDSFQSRKVYGVEHTQTGQGEKRNLSSFPPSLPLSLAGSSSAPTREVQKDALWSLGNSYKPTAAENQLLTSSLLLNDINSILAILKRLSNNLEMRNTMTEQNSQVRIPHPVELSGDAPFTRPAEMVNHSMANLSSTSPWLSHVLTALNQDLSRYKSQIKTRLKTLIH